MKTFILCEGRTDSHLIGFYLESAKKAKLGCYLSIYSPDWSLDKITEKIKQIDMISSISDLFLPSVIYNLFP